MNIRREWKIRIVWLVLGVLIGSLPQCSTWWRMDDCLDQGGQWNKQTGQCDF